MGMAKRKAEYMEGKKARENFEKRGIGYILDSLGS
jgi:hypothetical protein